jgi:hypothetical protein
MKIRALADLYIENQTLREQLSALSEGRSDSGSGESGADAGADTDTGADAEAAARLPDLVDARVPRQQCGTD